MIIGDDFVWLHFPKCAGTTVEHALRTLLTDRRDVQFDPVDPSNVIWHHTVVKREKCDPSFTLGKRRVVCCFRRLPMWLLSRVHYEATRGPEYRTVTRDMLLKGVVYEHDGTATPADAYAEVFSSPRVDHWIRVEHLAEDLSAVFGLERSAVQAVLGPKNVTSIDYLKPLSFWFTAKELSRIYAANPIWSRIERKAYGSLLVLPERPRFRPIVRSLELIRKRFSRVGRTTSSGAREDPAGA